MERIFVRGNEALCLGAIDAGLKFYSGYPITPQNDIPEFLSRELPVAGGQFIQSESEVSAVNMLLGAATCGVRAMTSSSSPGISLMQEAISFMAGSEIPAVIVNVARWGPGLGGIGASQGDYYQATKGGGHGDYYTPVLAPYSAQEMYDLIIKAFEMADKYRMPSMVLADVLVSLMKEPIVRRHKAGVKVPGKPWAFGERMTDKQKILKSLYMEGDFLKHHNWHLHAKFEQMMKEDAVADVYKCDDADIIVVAFGMVARIAKSTVELARAEGIKAGLFRPVTLVPYPEKELEKLTKRCSNFIVMEMNTGQMLYDVKRILGKEVKIGFYGNPSSYASTPEELLEKIKEQC